MHIADTYNQIYDHISTHGDQLLAMEEKADFDMALSSIGRGNWHGLRGDKISDYRGFGKLQTTVIADILSIPDYYLSQQGYKRIPQMRGTAYIRMVNSLNGVKNPGGRELRLSSKIVTEPSP